MSSPSNLNTVHNLASHRRSALAAMLSNTGCTSVGERLITRRTSLVAVCCSRASVAERCKSAYDGAGGASVWGRWRGVPHSPQNFIVGRFSYWHPGHVMPEPPSGRGGRRSESWAETNRLGLAWSRTRSHGSRLGTARSRHPRRTCDVRHVVSEVATSDGRDAVIQADRMSPLVALTPAPALLPGVNRVMSLHVGKRSHGDFQGL